MTFEEWSKCSLVLAGTYDQSFGVNELKLETWFRLLEDLPGAAVEAAVLHLCKTKPAFPSVADIRALAEGRSDDDCTLVWEEVAAKAHQLVYPTYVGTPEGPKAVPVEWSNPLVPMALDAVGGALAFMQCDAANVGVMRKHFYTAFKALQEKAEMALSLLERGVDLPPALARQFPIEVLEILRAPQVSKAKPLSPPPPKPSLPAPDEVVPMPADFPAAWRHILNASPNDRASRLDRPQGKGRHLAKVVRLNEVLRGDDSTPA